MTASSTLLALFLMPLCLWVYSRHWINTTLVQLLPLGAVSLTLGSTLLPIGLGVLVRYRQPRAADLLVKVGTAPTGRPGGEAAWRGTPGTGLWWKVVVEVRGKARGRAGGAGSAPEERLPPVPAAPGAGEPHRRHSHASPDHEGKMALR